MPFNNYNNRHFSTQEDDLIKDLLTQLEAAFAQKMANLTPEERQRFGSISQQNKLVVQRVRDYSVSHTGLKNPDVDWVEFEADFRSRMILEHAIDRLRTLERGISNAKILHDYDNFQAALRDYEYAKFKNNSTTPGYEGKVKEIGRFFAGGNNRRNTTEDKVDNIDAE